MKKVTMIALLAFGISLHAAAQERQIRHQKSAAEIARLHTEHMTKTLGLTEKQEAEVYALNLERAERLKESRGDRQTRMAKLREEQKKAKDRLNEVLTEEQREAWNKELAERRERMKTMRRPNQAGQSDQRMRRHHREAKTVDRQPVVEPPQAAPAEK